MTSLSPLFNKICIIGIGHIGSSIARAARKFGVCHQITCLDQSSDALKQAEELNLVDHAYAFPTEIKAALEQADLIILAVSISVMEPIAKAIMPYLTPGTIVTDVGSVKAAVVKAVLPHIPSDVFFIPAHPIAGRESSGPASGEADLFSGRWQIITPLPHKDDDLAYQSAKQKLAAMWLRFGSNIEEMSPEHHDKVLAITSHLPHLIAYTIVGTASDLASDLQSEVIKFSASGFRDFTRIAASNPIMWRDIFLNNREAVLDVLQRFTEDLTALQRAIRKGEGNVLEQKFTQTRKIRRNIIDAKQA